MATVVEWIARPDGTPIIRHARVAGSASTLCGFDNPLGTKRAEAGLRCTVCMELAGRISTPVGQLVYAALKRVNVSLEVWQLADHVVEINSKLAIDLREAREKVESLYRPQAE